MTNEETDVQNQSEQENDQRQAELQAKQQQDRDSIGQAIMVIEDARESLKSLLFGANDMLLIGAETKLNLIANQLRMASGVNPTIKIANVHDFPPITEFMGEPLKRASEISEEDLTPQQLEQKNFSEKVTRLQNALPNLENQAVLESFQNDQRVIRGVAKRAGLEDFKTAEINESFLDNIRNGLLSQSQQRKNLARTERELRVAEQGGEFEDIDSEEEAE